MNQKNDCGKLHKLQWIAELLIFVFAAECVFGGSGRLLAIGPISIRMMLFALAFVATLPFVWMKKDQLIRNPGVIAAVVFGVAVLASAVLGVANGNAMGFVRADVTSFLALALLPGMVAVMDDRKKLHTLLNIVFYMSVVVAAVSTYLHFSFSWLDNRSLNAINDWVNLKSLGGLAMLATRIHRVYLRAQIFLQFSILIGVWKIWTTENLAKRVMLFLCEGLMLFGVIASYTRSFWVGFAVSACVVLVLEWKSWKKLITVAAVACVIMLSIGGISTKCYGQPYVFIEIVNRFDSNLIVLSADEETEPVQKPVEEDVPADTQPEAVPAPTEQVDIVAQANQNAVNLRRDSLAALNEKIAEHPILGSGLGTNLDGVRQDGKTEYMYQDILMKMGLIGLILFSITYFMTSAIHIVRRFKRFNQELPWKDDMVLGSFLVGGLIGVAVTSAFNPFLTTPMGILVLIITNLSVLENYGD